MKTETTIEPQWRERQIDFLDKLWSDLMRGNRRSKLERAPGEGEQRAAERLRAKRAANAQIPSGYVATRQQRRREAILREKQALTVAKKQAEQQRVMGGSARIRSLVDAEAILG